MTTGKLGTDQIELAVSEIDEIFEDVKNARTPESAGGKKITWAEGVSIVLSDAGKVFKLTNAAESIWDQIKDLESAEAAPIIAALKALYDPANPFAEPFALKVLECILKGKEAGELYGQLKAWKPETTE